MACKTRPKMPGYPAGRGFPGRNIAMLTFGAGQRLGFTQNLSCRTGKVGPRLMRLDDILLPLSGSLAQCCWTGADIEAHLRQRLPRTWSRSPAILAGWLLTAFPGSTAPDAPRLARALRDSPFVERLVAHARKTDSLPAPALTLPIFRPVPLLRSCPFRSSPRRMRLPTGSPSRPTN